MTGSWRCDFVRPTRLTSLLRRVLLLPRRVEVAASLSRAMPTIHAPDGHSLFPPKSHPPCCLTPSNPTLTTYAKPFGFRRPPVGSTRSLPRAALDNAQDRTTNSSSPSALRRRLLEGGKGAYGSVIWRLTLTVAPLLTVTVAL